MTCRDFKRANYDIVVEGLGWISVQGKGPVSFLLKIPKEIKYHIRDDPL